MANTCTSREGSSDQPDSSMSKPSTDIALCSSGHTSTQQLGAVEKCGWNATHWPPIRKERSRWRSGVALTYMTRILASQRYKWLWALFIQLLDRVAINAWILYKVVHGKHCQVPKKSSAILFSLHLHISLDRKHKRPIITQHRQMWTPDVAEAAAPTIIRASRVTWRSVQPASICIICDQSQHCTRTI